MTGYEILSLVVAIITLLITVITLVIKLITFLDTRYQRKR